MKNFLLGCSFIFMTLFVNAQETVEKAVYDHVSILLKGKIQDEATNLGIQGAVIQIKSVNSGTTDNPGENFFSTNAIAKSDGSFEVENIPFAEQYNLIISAVGYNIIDKVISFDEPGKEVSGRKAMITKDLETLHLMQESNKLQAVVVTASKPTMQFGIDRKIFNVEQNITSQGATAVDVMKNIPSLTVDIDGNVQMRNSSPQILIDNRPTILTLDQIPSDDIERVELITNPSSKFDASNAGGIINIVLKKTKRVGFNGLASLGAGTPGVLNGNLNLNLRHKKINVFASGNYNQSGGQTHEETFRQNKEAGTIKDYFNQFSDNERKRRFASARFGVDYFMNDKNTFSFSQGFVNGKFDNNQLQNQFFLDKTQLLDHTGLRTSDGTGEFLRSNSRLSYERVFDRPDKKLSADISYNHGNRDDASFIINSFKNKDGGVFAPDNLVRNAGSGKDNSVTAQVDYENKMNENKKIEFGLRSYYSNTSTSFGSFSVDPSSRIETRLPLSNDYKYNETVNAGYFNYANKLASFKYQVGLRAEFSRLNGEMLDSSFQFGYSYPDKPKDIWNALFPSIFITKQLDEDQDIQFNYSKRIRRPRFWEVNPFVDINDPLNIQQGNPALKPEYINSFEINYFNRFQSGSFLGAVYFKNNVGDITSYSDTITDKLYQQLSNAGISPNAILNTFINAGHTNRYGAELTWQQKLSKSFDLTYNLNLQYRTTNAVVGKLNLSNEGFNWDTKLIANYKIGAQDKPLFSNTSFQLVANYEGPRIIPQGRRKAEFVTDFALRKEFLKNKRASLSFNINDVFNTRKFGTIYDTENFYQDSYRRWNVRSFRLTFSYKFGSGDFDWLKKKGGNDNGGDQG